tara:strand:+ start:1303 stop:1641 length:339 start_codon:yes stop_codon:yes gene_type:complete
MSLSDEQWEFGKDIGKLIVYAEENGFKLTFGEAYRTVQQQKIYVKTGRSKTMRSKHMKRCAMDFNVFVDGKLTWDKEVIRPLGEYWESLNAKNRWGGNFKSFIDVPHFERNV